MFRGFINDAKTAAGSVVSKIVVRATVLVPFLIAGGFATAGLTILLIESFGARDTYFTVAGGFAVIGILAAVLVRSKEQEEAVADEQAVQAETDANRPLVTATESVVAAAEQIPLAFIGSLSGLLSNQAANPESLIAAAKGLGRNLPLVLFLAFLGLLLWPNEHRDKVGASASPHPDPFPNGSKSATNGSHHPFGMQDGDLR